MPPEAADHLPSEIVTMILEADGQTRGVNVRISPDQRDELVRQLQLAELPVRYVIEESAAQTLKIIATFVGPAIVGARALPREAWTALGDVLTAVINKNEGRRVEITFGDGQKIIVEKDRRAVRETVDQLVPVVRQQMVDRQRRWDQLQSDVADSAATAPNEDEPADVEGSQ